MLGQRQQEPQGNAPAYPGQRHSGGAGMAAGAGREGVSCEALPFTEITGTIVLK